MKPVGPLAGLSDADLRALAGCAVRRSFAHGEEILAQGHANASLFIVEDGLLHARRISGKREVLLGRIEPGSFFGELSLFDPGPTTAAVQALSDGVLIEIARSALEQFLAAHPAAGARILWHILHDVAQRLRRADERLADTIVWGGLMGAQRG